MMDSLFKKKKKKQSVQEFFNDKDLFWWTRTFGVIALVVCFLYWGFFRSEEHANLSRVLLGSVLCFNLFYIYGVYNREMKRREREKE